MKGHESVPGARPSIPGDLITGAAEIADFIFGDTKRVRSVYRLAETTSIPIFKVGAQLGARRSRLTEWMVEQENRAAQKREVAA
jgi:hypothetical protein